MAEIINCPNCGQEVSEDRLIRIYVGRSCQCLCPKCYRRGSGEADARASESKRVFFLKGEKSKVTRRR